jgi:plasmid stabilization system protein ParE
MSRLKVFWTASPRNELRLIKRYYKDKAGVTVAQRIIHDIKVYVDILKCHPEAGQEEETLKSLNEGHRYLVKGNYKIIYKLFNNAIFITDVFDTRQNPNKLIKRSKKS